MNFSKRRGQAFETMMLVISVIVALAILGVLMGILGNVGGNISADPSQVMKDKLNEIGGKYSAGTTPVTASFPKKTYEVKELVAESSAVLEQDLKFVFTPKLTDSQVAELDAEGKSFTVNKAFKGVIVACSNPDTNSYVISIGREKEEKDTAQLCRDSRTQ